MNNKFLLAHEVKLLIKDLDGLILLLPRKEFVLKNKLQEDLYELLELIYFTNYLSVKERALYQKKILTKVSMIDYYIERCFNNKYLSEKQVLSFSRKLLKINKMIMGWINGSKT